MEAGLYEFIQLLTEIGKDQEELAVIDLHSVSSSLDDRLTPREKDRRQEMVEGIDAAMESGDRILRRIVDDRVHHALQPLRKEIEDLKCKLLEKG